MKISFAVTLLVVVLFACSAEPTPTPAPTVDVGAIQTQAAVAVLATQTASAPTATFTAEPTDTPLPAPTLSPTPEFTPTSLPEPTQTPSIEPTSPPLPTSVPPTPVPVAEFTFQWKNPFYECQRLNKPWTLQDGSLVAGARSFQITIALKNISADKTIEPPWEPSRSVITNGQTTRVQEGFWQWGQRVRRGEVNLYDQPTVGPGVVAEWTFITFPVQQDEWVDHIEWDLFDQTYRSDNFGPGEFNNNYNYRFCPQE